MAEQAYAYVTLIPVATGFQKSIAKELGGAGNVGATAGGEISKQMNNSFGSGAQKLGSTLKGALGAAGIAVGIASIVNGLKDATKAAIDDEKSQALLANQLKVTTGATAEQVAAVEGQISSMSRSASVADDEIRPAFMNLVRATGDTTVALGLQKIALDVAAGTGRDLESVSLAIGKAVNGQTGSLQRLVPSIKGASDPMGELAKQFDGAAKAAANTDPLKRINVLFGEIQERVGRYLLPALNNLADFMASPEFADGIDSVFEGFDKIDRAFTNVGNKIPWLKSGFDGLGKVFGNGDWVKLIPILGAYIDILAGKKPIPAANSGVMDAYRYNTRQLADATKTLDLDPDTPEPKGKTPAQLRAELARDFKKNVLDGLVEGMTASEASLKETAGKAMEWVSEAFLDKKITLATAKAAHAMIQSYKKQLEPLVKEHDEVVKKLTEAQNVLAEKIAEKMQYIDRISKQYGSTLQIEEKMTAADAIKSLRDRINKTVELSSTMEELQKLGLSGDLYQQIIDSGNLDFAKSILAGGEATVKELNSLAEAANKTALKLGEQAGSILFDKGIQAAEGVVKGLEARKAELEGQMKYLAGVFASELALLVAGIKIPMPEMPVIPIPVVPTPVPTPGPIVTPGQDNFDDTVLVGRGAGQIGFKGGTSTVDGLAPVTNLTYVAAPNTSIDSEAALVKAVRMVNYLQYA